MCIPSKTVFYQTLAKHKGAYTRVRKGEIFVLLIEKSPSRPPETDGLEFAKIK
jgi:hypothetical protein